MEVSGEVADLMVKEGLEAAKIATELSAKGLVHVAALLAAMVKQNYKVVGKVGIERLMKDSNAESVIIAIKAADYEKFQKIAKQFGVLYAAAKRENKENGVLHIISNVNYSAQLNAVMETMGYPLPEMKQEEQAAKKAKARAPQERSSDERGTGLTQPQRDEKPSTRQKLAELDAVAKQKKQRTPVRSNDRVR